MQSDLNHLQENFDDFFETALCGFLIADVDGKIIRANEKLKYWLNQSTEGLIGKRFSDLLSISSKVYFETHLRPLFRLQGYFDEVVLELRSAEEIRIKVLVNAYERRDKDNKPHFIRYTILKGSDRLQYEQNLKITKAMAEEELKRKKEDLALRDQLIAVLGHDLRNPLSSIQMASHMLVAEKGSENASILAILKRSSNRMAELITNIMDFARTRLGHGLILDMQETMLEPEMLHVVDELKLMYPNSKITTSFNIKKPIKCDSNRLSQLVSNLLANALNHGDANFPVHLKGNLINNELELSVTNNGIPIPAHINNQLFAPFVRGAQSENQNGLGIGLFISAKIANSHKGSLSHSSTDNTNTFTFKMKC